MEPEDSVRLAEQLLQLSFHPPRHSQLQELICECAGLKISPSRLIAHSALTMFSRSACLMLSSFGMYGIYYHRIVSFESISVVWKHAKKLHYIYHTHTHTHTHIHAITSIIIRFGIHSRRKDLTKSCGQEASRIMTLVSLRLTMHLPSGAHKPNWK